MDIRIISRYGLRTNSTEVDFKHLEMGALVVYNYHTYQIGIISVRNQRIFYHSIINCNLQQEADHLNSLQITESVKNITHN